MASKNVTENLRERLHYLYTMAQNQPKMAENGAWQRKFGATKMLLLNLLRQMNGRKPAKNTKESTLVVAARCGYRDFLSDGTRNAHCQRPTTAAMGGAVGYCERHRYMCGRSEEGCVNLVLGEGEWCAMCKRLTAHLDAEEAA